MSVNALSGAGMEEEGRQLEVMRKKHAAEVSDLRQKLVWWDVVTIRWDTTRREGGVGDVSWRDESSVLHVHVYLIASNKPKIDSIWRMVLLFDLLSFPWCDLLTDSQKFSLHSQSILSHTLSGFPLFSTTLFINAHLHLTFRTASPNDIPPSPSLTGMRRIKNC